MEDKILIEEGWSKVLKEEFENPYMRDLQNFLIEEEKLVFEVYPPNNLIFNAFCKTPYENVKAVIIGQDPYHGSGQAQGLSFSVPEGIRQPPSLKNIFKELIDDVGIEMPKTGNLEPWAKQGVLLLNATLTVRKSSPKSHYGKGWEVFTDRVMQILLDGNDPIVFLLWGRSALEKLEKVYKEDKHSKHLILKAAHPSFYSAHNFFGCKHFSKANEFLIKNKKKPIDWQIT